MFYNKQLGSLEELQAERAAIKKKAKKKAKAIEKTADDHEGNMLEKGIGFLSGSLTGNAKLAPVLEIASKVALPYLLKRGAQLGVRKIAMTAAKEVAFGYVKWKAISIAATIIANKLKKRKEEKEKEAR